MATQTFTAGQVLTAAQMTTLQSNSGLQLVKAETTVTAAASATADSIFTSAYTNYLVLVNYTTTASNSLLVKLRASATSASTNYNQQQINANGSSAAAARTTAQTSMELGVLSAGDFKSSSKMEVFTPQLAQATNFIIANSSNPSGLTSPLLWYVTGNHSTATAYDGLEFLVASGTWTGTYAVYGYSKTV